jgi:hypothetical protein
MVSTIQDNFNSRAIPGRTYRVKHIWVYMLLGQVVAISVASNLFYYAIATSVPPKSKQVSRTTSVSPVLWLSILVSLGTVAYSPYSTESTFLPNLLVMHALLVLPLVLSAHPWKAGNMKVKTLRRVIALAALAMHLKATATAFSALPSHSRTLSGLLRAVVDTLYYHPAQSSIGWDVVWTSVSFLVWTLYSPAGSETTKTDSVAGHHAKSSEADRSGILGSIIRALIATAVGSIGFAAPLQA